MIQTVKKYFSRLVQWLLTGETRSANETIAETENYEFRMLMKDQLKQLKDKGLPLRIMTL
jgi:hypothetical protein